MICNPTKQTIQEIEGVLNAIQGIKPLVTGDTTISETVSIFEAHGFESLSDKVLYGECCDYVTDMSLPIREGVHLDLARGRIQVSLRVTGDSTGEDFLIDSLHGDNMFHMELMTMEEISCLKDVSNHEWFDCGNNRYPLNEQSQNLLQAIHRCNGLTKEKVKEHRLAAWVEEQAREYRKPRHGRLKKWQVEQLESLPNWREHAASIASDCV